MLGMLIAATALASFTGPDTRGDIVDWVSPDDYPEKSREAREEGSVVYTITVSQTGKPKTCQVTSSSGFKDLDNITCASMLVRGSFKPAADALGHPLVSTYRNAVNWYVQDSHGNRPVVVGDIVLSVAALPKNLGKRPLVSVYGLVGPDGVASSCSFEPRRTAAGLEKAACSAVLSQWHFTPMKDDAGLIVPSVQNVLVAFEVSH
jgi:TonB family protein